MQDDEIEDESGYDNPDTPTEKKLKKFFAHGSPRSSVKGRKGKRTKFVEPMGEYRERVRHHGEDLAEILKMRFYQGLGYSEIVKLTGWSLSYVTKCIKPFKVMMDDPERIRAFRANEPEMLDGIRALGIQALFEQLSDPARRKKVDISRLTYMFGVLFDKARLSRGESTSNVKSLSDLVRAAQELEINPPKEEAQIMPPEVKMESNGD